MSLSLAAIEVFPKFTKTRNSRLSGRYVQMVGYGAAIPRLTTQDWPAMGTRAFLGMNICAFCSLPGSSLRLSKPILVTIEALGDDNFVARMEDANINASGDTQGEALENLIDIIEAKYELLSSMSQGVLGPGPARQLGILRGYIRTAQ
jgi:hypothetical protein